MRVDYKEFEKRKQEHIELALEPSSQASDNELDKLSLTHEALPDFNFSEINISSYRFGKLVPSPFFVSSMTAGHKNALSINYTLVAACAKSGWAMGVGSQRRELTDPNAKLAWQKIRLEFPKVKLFSNLGIAQVINTPVDEISRLVEALEAEALIIHCNPLQEVIQPEGTPQFKGSLLAIKQLVKILPIPIVIKETGCGFSAPTLHRLNDLGIKAVDVSGLGGTHWGRIESKRALHGSIKQRSGETFSNWGIGTVSSVKNAISLQPNFEIWGSGGVRHGLDAAKLLALGVTSVGFAKPMLIAALKGAAEVYELMQTIEYELRIAMFCTGSITVDLLRASLCH